MYILFAVFVLFKNSTFEKSTAEFTFPWWIRQGKSSKNFMFNLMRRSEFVVMNHVNHTICRCLMRQQPNHHSCWKLSIIFHWSSELCIGHSQTARLKYFCDCLIHANNFYESCERLPFDYSEKWCSSQNKIKKQKWTILCNHWCHAPYNLSLIMLTSNNIH